MIIYLDFDGTVVEHKYPRMGKYNTGSLEVIEKLQKAGHDIILNTYRADCKNGTLEQAFTLINDILKTPITKYCVKKLYPDVFDWSTITLTNELFIDDIALDMPLKNGMVDWSELNKQFIKNDLYKKI